MFVLCNPKAGHNTEAIARYLEKVYRDLFIIRIEGKDNFRKALEEMAEEKRRITVMGGDGTVNLACQVLANSNVSLGIIPTGDDNDFSNALGIPKDPFEAMKVARIGKNKLIDLGKVNDTYFCNSFGIGFDADVLKLAKEYKSETLQKLFQCTNFPVKADLFLENNESMLFEDALMVTFANGETECGGIKINKDFSFNDHKLGATIVRKMSKTSKLFSFLFLFSNFFDFNNSISYQKVDFAELEILNQVKMHVDGEEFFSEKLDVKICPDALRIIIA